VIVLIIDQYSIFTLEGILQADIVEKPVKDFLPQWQSKMMT
jgi:hypothetical protein